MVSSRAAIQILVFYFLGQYPFSEGDEARGQTLGGKGVS